MIPFEIDGVKYLVLEEEDKVAGWAAVPIKLLSEGYSDQPPERDCRMVAGVVGMKPGKHEELGVSLTGPEPEPAEREYEYDGSFWVGCLSRGIVVRIRGGRSIDSIVGRLRREHHRLVMV